MKYKIGVDLGGTNIAAGIVDESNNIIASKSTKTNLPRPREEVEALIAQLCIDIAQQSKINFIDIACVGIGTPGSVDPSTGIVGFNANFAYHDWHLAQAMEKLLKCKVYVENDANAAAYGEYLAGAAKGAASAVMITLGTGIGGGIIIDNKIYAGFNKAGAELGHMVIDIGGRPCMCGRKGCWEKYASARSLAEDTKAAMLSDKNTLMWKIVDNNIDNVNAKTAFEAMKKGDIAGTALVEKYVDYIACGLINVINIFQPQIICIGGGVSHEGDALLEKLQNRIDKEDYARSSNLRTRICMAKLYNNAGIIGAANLGK
ncbi:MAG: ROK family protein [Oscillospiraceae bacterium]